VVDRRLHVCGHIGDRGQALREAGEVEAREILGQAFGLEDAEERRQAVRRHAVEQEPEEREIVLEVPVGRDVQLSSALTQRRAPLAPMRMT
jgi:hypothetical protein